MLQLRELSAADGALAGLGGHADPPEMTIVSVGYQGRSVDELIDVLRCGEVELLVDVRLNPISRRPGFSKKPLSQALAEAGIGYRHERALGNPRDNRDPFDRERYEAYLLEVGSAALAEVMELARSSRIALMCYERQHPDCHRSAILDLAARQHSVIVQRM